jgi:hypothetical protein
MVRIIIFKNFVTDKSAISWALFWSRPVIFKSETYRIRRRTSIIQGIFDESQFYGQCKSLALL